MQRLFIYGTLSPNGPNAHVLNEIGGEWEAAVIKGYLIEEGWGSSMGYPGLVVDDNGEDVHGYVFNSVNLEKSWCYLDGFEGEDYERMVTTVTLANGGQVQAYVYALRSK
jgi:gamma-glutamylcyclotransferase (GGCT)/AIG2-like uncharacterized protein YtfP